MIKTKQGIFTLVCFAFLLPVLLSSLPALASETCYLDSPHGYQRMGGASRLGPYSSRPQCDSVNIQYFRGSGRCSCTPTSSGSYGGTNPYQNLFNNLFAPMGEAISKQMECLFNPNCEANIQQQQQQQRFMEMQRQEEQLRKQEAERGQMDFDRKKSDLLNQMRVLPELNVREVGDVFGTKALKPRDLSSPTQVASLSSAPTTALQKAHCTAYLLRKANDAASQGRLEESAYLSSEAADLMSGAKDSPGVVCPPPPEVPSVEGGPIVQSGEQAQKLQKMTFVYSKLRSQAAQQVGDYQAVLTRVKRAEEKIEKAKLQKEEAKTKVDRLRTQKQEQTDSASASAMAEAFAALKETEAVLQESQKDLAEAEKEKLAMETKMNRTRDLFIQARDHPEDIDDVYKLLAPKSQGGSEK